MDMFSHILTYMLLPNLPSDCPLKRFQSMPCLLIGDFNCVRFIEDLGLEEINVGNDCSTWFGPKDKKSKLDRSPVNSQWLETGQWNLTLLNRMNSDHKPLFLASGIINWGPKPFKCYDWWFKDSSLLYVI